jgi:hypothetical protein
VLVSTRVVVVVVEVATIVTTPTIATTSVTVDSTTTTSVGQVSRGPTRSCLDHHVILICDKLCIQLTYRDRFSFCNQRRNKRIEIGIKAGMNVCNKFIIIEGSPSSTTSCL